MYIYRYIYIITHILMQSGDFEDTRMYEYMYIICIYMSSVQNYVKFNAMHKLGRPLSVVRISVLPEVSQMECRYRVVPYRF